MNVENKFSKNTMLVSVRIRPLNKKELQYSSLKTLQIEKISDLLKAKEHKRVLKNGNSTSAMKYIVKIENADDEVGYLLPIKIY